MNNNIIAISGISGAGKTTIGKLLAEKLGGIFIDQDWFFNRKKPIVKLPNGKTLLNYDSDEAIDVVRFNNFIEEKKKYNRPIVISGFALRNYFFYKSNEPKIHFHIRVPKELSLETRLKLKVKVPSEERKQNEKYMFNKYVYPYYEETIKNSKIDYYIDGTETTNGVIKRKNINKILDEILIKL